MQENLHPYVEKIDTKHWPTSGAMLWVGQHQKEKDVDLESKNAEELTDSQSSALKLTGSQSLKLEPADQESSDFKSMEAYQYAVKLLCQDNKRSLALLNAQAHPDFFVLKPKEDSRVIKIDQVRELIEWSTGTPQIASRKIAIIVPADALNLQAANGLLKTLEESSENTLFILITNRPDALPATVISRCYVVRSGNSATKHPISHGLIYQKVLEDLKALSSEKSDPVSVASNWVKHDLIPILDALITIVAETIYRFSEEKKIIPLRAALDGMDKIYQTKKVLLDNVSVNTQLLIESLLIRLFLLYEAEAKC